MTAPSLIRTSTFVLAFLGACLLWAAFPPVDLWPLAWIAPTAWVMLILRKKLDGNRPYYILWLVGFMFWMAVLQWLRLPYWATAFGWVALSFYFAFYLPVFIGLSRIAVHQLRLPVILVAPVVWTGLELARAHILTGLTIASLGHTQYRWIQLIQISDLAGAFGVSFVVMFVAACIAQALPYEGKPRTFWPIMPVAAMLFVVLGYGYARTANNNTTPGARIALIQGSLDSQFDNSDDMEQKMRDCFRHYFDLSLQAVKKFGQVDLIVWPETYFIYPLVTYDTDAGSKNPELKKTGLSMEEYLHNIQLTSENSQKAFDETTSRMNSPMLVGLERWHFTAEGIQRLNSAAHLSIDGKVLGYYDKMHLVMFGEYIPFADYLTWLYDLSPLAMATTSGTQPAAFQVRNIRVATNICFESFLSHFIRGQINTLQDKGQEPDVLVNMTNDGWFWGSSELDLHLTCGVFRAVECRKPFLIAANTGFSAWIDADGRIIEQGPRRATAALLAEVRIDNRKSWYLYYGDWPAGICLFCCSLVATLGSWKHFRNRD